MGQGEPARILYNFASRPHSSPSTSCQKLVNLREPEVLRTRTFMFFDSMSAVKKTPTKSCTVRKPQKETINSYCRCCEVSLKVKYSDTWKSISTENLFLPSKKRGFEGEILSRVLESAAGIKLNQSASFSERLCKTCAIK